MPFPTATLPWITGLIIFESNARTSKQYLQKTFYSYFTINIFLFFLFIIDGIFQFSTSTVFSYSEKLWDKQKPLVFPICEMVSLDNLRQLLSGIFLKGSLNIAEWRRTTCWLSSYNGVTVGPFFEKTILREKEIEARGVFARSKIPYQLNLIRELTNVIR